MKYFTLAALAAMLGTLSARAASVTVTGQTAGPTPFIAQIQLTANPPTSVKTITFQITPKPGSVTRPVNAKYSIAYLQSRGYFNSTTGAILLPIFGLYANYSNSVSLTYRFTDNSSQQANVMVSTPAFNDTCSYTTPTVVQPRTNSTSLSYDYILVKNICGNYSPVIIDTDGAVRWVGTAGVTNLSSTFYQNSIFLGAATKLYRIELDGVATLLRDYASAGVLDFHHNIDPGKYGLLTEIDTPSQLEDTIMEVDTAGNILRTWDMVDIVAQAMVDGGDGERISEFVQPGVDWFHNNATTYRKSDDTLVISSRENFVIAVDYETGDTKWILGDTTKQWGEFPSLIHFALNLGANTLSPIGQHAVSFTRDDRLMLFDNGKNSQNHAPPGIDRSYSAPRKYDISTQTGIATQVWSYESNRAFYSPFCSSIYEDNYSNYVIDYAITGPTTPTPPVFGEILGLDDAGNRIFHYKYPTHNCDQAFNSLPIHFESLLFTALPAPTVVSRKSHGAAGNFDVPLPLTGKVGIECRSGGVNHNYQIVMTFATPVTIGSATVTPGNGGTATISGSPILNSNQVIVNLTNVSNGQNLTLNLTGVSDGSHTDNLSVPMAILVGDTTGNGVVNASDIAQVKAQSGISVSGPNFRRDLTVSGSINSSDLAMVKIASGSAITGQK
jgi:arylsulfate sulfotransferase